jgi:quercetin dioxygenase-like cupin family protein
MAFQSTTRAVPHVQRDDDALRITRWDFVPGAITGWHEHEYPYFIIMMIAGTLRIDDGQTQRDVQLFACEAYMREAGVKHDVQNASPHAISFVEIEIKRPAQLFGKSAESAGTSTTGSSPIR